MNGISQDDVSAIKHINFVTNNSHNLITELYEDLMERDHRDRNRAIAPLKQAEDAKLLDTTHMTISEGIKQIVGWVELVS